MHLKFTATFNVEDYKTHNVTKKDDILLLRYAEVARDKVRRELRKIVKKNDENMMKGRPPVEIEIDANIHYAHRSLDQNRWLWAAHTLEANIINGGLAAWNDSNIRWRKAGTVTPEQIHEDYMELYGPMGFVDVQPDFTDAIRKMLEETQGHVIHEEWIDDIKKMRFTVRKTSSYMNTREFSELADHITSNLLAYGIDISTGEDFQKLLEDLQTLKNKAEVLTEPKESAIVDKEIDIF